MTDDNVRALFGDRLPTPQGEPVPQVVAFIKRLLARAEAGDMCAIAVAYVGATGSISDGWERDGDHKLTFILHSAITCLAHEFTAEINGTGRVTSTRDDNEPDSP